MELYEQVEQLAIDSNVQLLYGEIENVDVKSMTYDDAVKNTIEWLLDNNFTNEEDLTPLFKQLGF